MTYVVTEPCVGCKHADCVEVCPTDCFHEGEEMLFINPRGCIDCGACIPACPENAIFEDKNVPDKWKKYIVFNAQKVFDLPVLTEKEDCSPI